MRSHSLCFFLGNLATSSSNSEFTCDKPNWIASFGLNNSSTQLQSQFPSSTTNPTETCLRYGSPQATRPKEGRLNDHNPQRRPQGHDKSQSHRMSPLNTVRDLTNNPSDQHRQNQTRQLDPHPHSCKQTFLDQNAQATNQRKILPKPLKAYRKILTTGPLLSPPLPPSAPNLHLHPFTSPSLTSAPHSAKGSLAKSTWRATALRPMYVRSRSSSKHRS